MDLTLYSNSFNSAGERVRVACALKGVEYEYISIQDIGWDAYQEINPQRILPTLKAGDALLTQSTAILEYLEEVYPTPALLPSDPIVRAQARAFGQSIASEMHAIDVMRVRRFLSDELAVNETGVEAWTAHWFNKGLETLEALLVRRDIQWDCCYSNEPGWAELFLVPQLRKSVERFGLDLSAYPKLAGVYARCVNLPAFVKAAPENQQDYVGMLPPTWETDKMRVATATVSTKE